MHTKNPYKSVLRTWNNGTKFSHINNIISFEKSFSNTDKMLHIYDSDKKIAEIDLETRKKVSEFAFQNWLLTSKKQELGMLKTCFQRNLGVKILE